MYIRANFLINNSVLDFRAVAFCTKSKILAIELFLNSLVTSTLITLSKLILPANTFAFLTMVSGLLSPVKAAVLRDAFSEAKIPSSGIFSPTLICIISPIATVSGGTLSISPFRKTLASFGRTSNNAFIFPLALLTAAF